MLSFASQLSVVRSQESVVRSQESGEKIRTDRIEEKRSSLFWFS